MTNFERMYVVLAACLVVTSCVSTSTGVEKADPDDGEAAELNYELGARYYNNGKYDLARDRLLKALEFNPKLPKAYTTLGLVYESLDNERLASEAYETAISLAPKDARVQNTYAVFMCRQGKFDAAAKHFKKSAELPDNDNAEVTLTNAGVCLAQKPDYALAESFFRDALEVRPNYGEALLQMALLKHQLEDDLIARAFMQRFLATNIASAGVLNLAMQIEESLGDEKASEEFANQILREYPLSAEARRILDAG